MELEDDDWIVENEPITLSLFGSLTRKGWVAWVIDSHFSSDDNLLSLLVINRT